MLTNWNITAEELYKDCIIGGVYNIGFVYTHMEFIPGEESLNFHDRMIISEGKRETVKTYDVTVRDQEKVQLLDIAKELNTSGKIKQLLFKLFFFKKGVVKDVLVYYAGETDKEITVYGYNTLVTLNKAKSD